jgi:hypothetical protein
MAGDTKICRTRSEDATYASVCSFCSDVYVRIAHHEALIKAYETELIVRIQQARLLLTPWPDAQKRFTRFRQRMEGGFVHGD